MILLWGVEDPPMCLVRRALQAMNASFLLVDQRNARGVHLDLTYSPTATGVLEMDGIAYPVEDFHAIYLRPRDFRVLPGIGDRDPESLDWQHAQRLQDMLWNFADLAKARVVNRPSAMLSNGSKPWQSRAIEEHGFAVPDTLITTDRSAARAFCAEHGAVIYKSISATRSIVGLMDCGDEGRLDDLRWCPTQLQRYVEGVEHRVHVVGSRVFAARILSDSIDYRYGSSRVEACEVPDEIAQHCMSLCRALGLTVAGIDLRRDPDGRWFCFEVNPAPGFSPFEQTTGQRIGRAIASILAEPVRPEPA